MIVNVKKNFFKSKKYLYLVFLISLKFEGNDDRIPLFAKDHIHLIDISNIIVSNREELSFLLAGKTFF